MAQHTVSTATLTCTMGAAPGVLNVLPLHTTLSNDMPAANIMDHIPITNIGSFGMCMSIANPQVAAATAAALGVLTPMPCIPATVTPWVPGSPTVLVGNMPALDSESMCMCMWAGVITIISAGQATHMVP